MKPSDIITRQQLITDRGWDDELIDLYIIAIPVPGRSNTFGKFKTNIYSKSEVIKAENYLTKIGIDWKMKE